MHLKMKWLALLLLHLTPQFVAMPTKERLAVKPGDYNVIGLVSVVKNDDITNSLRFVEAIRHSVIGVDEKFRRLQYLYNQLHYQIKFGYDIYNIFNSEVTMANTILETIFIMQNSTTDDCTCVSETKVSSILAFVVYLPSKFIQIAANLLITHKIALISCSYTTPNINPDIYQNVYRTTPDDKDQIDIIVKVALHYKWQYVGLIKSDTEYGKRSSGILQEALERVDICIGLNTHMPPNTEALRDTVLSIKRNTLLNVIVLWLLPKEAYLFLKMVEKENVLNVTWIASPAWTQHSFLYQITPSISHGILGLGFQSYRAEIFAKDNDLLFWNLSIGNAHENVLLKRFFAKQNITKDSGNITMSDFAHLFSLESIILILDINRTVNALTVFFSGMVEYDYYPDKRAFMYYAGKHYSLKNFMWLYFNFLGKSRILISQHDGKGTINYLTIAEQVWAQNFFKTFDMVKTDKSYTWAGFQKNPPNSKCQTHCNGGYYPERYFGKSCCIICQRCTEGFINLNKTQCHKCHKNLLPNKNQTECVEYIEEFVTYTSFAGRIIIVMSCFGNLATWFFGFTLIFYMNTPVVRSSSIFKSLIQLVSHFLIFNTPYLLLGKPTGSKCFVHVYLTGFLLTQICTITFIKTTQLILVFSAKTRVSQQYILFTKSTEAFIILVCTSIQISLSLGHFLGNPAPIKESKIALEYKNYIYCNTDKHFKIQVIYSISIAAVCVIQGIRARKLPSHYNELRFIVYSMFTYFVLMIAQFPVSFQLTEYHKLLLFNTTLLFLANFSTMFIMYGNKIYIIYRRPERNRVEYYKQKMAMHTLKQVMEKRKLK